MEEIDKNVTINGPDNLKFGIDEFENLSNDKNKNITKILKKEIMNEAVKWCEENIKGFNVSVKTDEQGNIIITGNCYIDDPNIEMLPYRIHKVEGNFSVCGDATVPRVMGLKSLNNFPRIITGNFKINLNPDLASLAGGPVEVGGYYNCSHCGLKNLNGIAKKIGHYIVAYKNPFIDIDDLENVEFSNIDLEYCDDIVESAMYTKLKDSGKLYEDLQNNTIYT